MQDQRAEIEWRDGTVPISTRFDDPYFSLDNGLAETRHVFLAGNDLPARFRDGFHIAELGFGTGLNFLTAWDAWRESGVDGRFAFTSFEAYPMAPSDMRAALSVFPEVAELADALLGQVRPASGSYEFDDVTLHLRIGNARETLPAWSGHADAWFLDGFSPAKNPELWQADLMQVVADHTALEGTAATYSAAGFVRRGLEEAGFEVARVPGYGRKRHMTQARLK